MDPLFSLNLLHQFLLLERVHIQEYILEQVLVEMTNGGVDRSIECTGNVQAMISAFESVHDVCILFFLVARIYSNLISSIPFSMFNDPKIFVAGLGCGCSCGGMENQDFPSRASPYTIFLGLPLSASTLLFILAV